MSGIVADGDECAVRIKCDVKGIGRRLYRARQAIGFSLPALAKLTQAVTGDTGLSFQYISDIETGRRVNIGVEKLAALCEALGIEPNDLLGMRKVASTRASADRRLGLQMAREAGSHE